MDIEMLYIFVLTLDLFQDWPEENYCSWGGGVVHCFRGCSSFPARFEEHRYSLFKSVLKIKYIGKFFCTPFRTPAKSSRLLTRDAIIVCCHKGSCASSNISLYYHPLPLQNPVPYLRWSARDDNLHIILHFRFHGGKYHHGTGFRQVFHQHGILCNLRVLERTLSDCYKVFTLSMYEDRRLCGKLSRVYAILYYLSPFFWSLILFFSVNSPSTVGWLWSNRGIITAWYLSFLKTGFLDSNAIQELSLA